MNRLGLLPSLTLCSAESITSDFAPPYDTSPFRERPIASYTAPNGPTPRGSPARADPAQTQRRKETKWD